MEPAPAIGIRDLKKVYGAKAAVDGLNLVVPRGSFFGLLGPNGAGKSTTIRMIMNILAPDSGTIELDGRPLGAADRERIGYLPEERGLYRKQKVNDVLLYLAALKGCPARVAQGRIDHWLERFDLMEWKFKKVDTLSKGMSQKVQFISTVAHDPDLVFLDEPFSGLDPVSADELLGFVREMKAAGKLVLFSTHVMEQAEKVCDRIVMLNKGATILDGDLREIRHAYGENSVTVSLSGRPEGAAAYLASLPSVAAVRDEGLSQVVTLAPGSTSDDLFQALSGNAHVASFAVNEPSLHSIFVKLAGPSADRKEA